MARRRKNESEAVTKTELQPPSSPAVFMFLWLVIPMVLMIGYAYYLRYVVS